MPRRFFLILTLMLLSISTVTAQSGTQPTGSDDYPTVTALQETDIPRRDPIALAQQLLGITVIPAPPPQPETYTVGEQRSFKILNTDAHRIMQIKAELKAIGEHIYIWIDTRATVPDGQAEALAEAFDQEIYPGVRDLWGVEANPGIDNDPRVFGLFTYGLGGSIVAYYSSSNTYPSEVVADSNEHEMFIYDLDSTGDDIDNWEVESTTAHEFQHMIRDHMTRNQDTWVNEGLSVFTQLYLDYQDGGYAANACQGEPETQLTEWAQGNISAHYGCASLWLTYFYERFGLKALQTASLDSASGEVAFDRMLKELDEPGFDAFFADWALANWWRDTSLDDGRYGYELLPNLTDPTRRSFNSYPAQSDDKTRQYSTDYFVLNGLPDSGKLTVNFDAPETVRLIPTDAHSGAWMWYSNRRDDSTTTLTHAFDLSGISSATLNYQVWYDTEDRWDYGYVMVSTDQGKTWTLLETPDMTDDNPNGTGYGMAYTGESDGWHEESISLDAYAGKSILIRFAMITDDASNLPGMAIDDVAVPELGYQSDFETDDGGWQSEGWIRIDNMLPQQAWVQISQKSDDNFRVTRWQYPTDQVMQVDLLENVDEVMLAISPFAPVTTVSMPYHIEIKTQ